MARSSTAVRKSAATLPAWNLDHLYAGPEAPALRADLNLVRDQSVAFAKAFKGRLADLDGAAFGGAIADYESSTEVLWRISSYAQLLFASDKSDAKIAKFYQTILEALNDVSKETLFFTLEINRLDEAVLARQMKDPKAARYAPWIRDLRAFKDHELGEELERLFHEKSVTGGAAWVRLFDETLASARFPLAGKSLTLSESLNLLSHRDRKKRQAAAAAVGQGLGEKSRLFGLVFNTLIKDKAIEDAWRHYPRPISYRNLSNYVEDEVVDALIGAVKSSYKDLAHRYYGLKAKWLGLKRLSSWDLLAPLPEASDSRYTWPEAKSLVLAAYRGFEPKLADLADQFFAGRWIDAAPRAGKDSGAFCHSTVPSVHPYVLLNFHGRARDVATLAHELGHGVHQMLASAQGTLMASTPLTLAETASVFGEMLAFQAMLERETNPKRRRLLLASKVEDMLNTVVRQIAFCEFETRLHAERKSGELLPERIGEIWLDVQRESLGQAFRFDEDYRHYWSYISHFVHAPFYVYAYAFGDCLVNSLYALFRSGHSGFQAKYLEMLRAGGTKRHKELLAPFGLDASDPKFWRQGLGIISGFIDELS